MDERDERRVLGRYRRRDGPADAAHGHVDDGGGQGPLGVSSDHRGKHREGVGAQTRARTRHQRDFAGERPPGPQ